MLMLDWPAKVDTFYSTRDSSRCYLALNSTSINIKPGHFQRVTPKCKILCLFPGNTNKYISIVWWWGLCWWLCHGAKFGDALEFWFGLVEFDAALDVGFTSLLAPLSPGSWWTMLMQMFCGHSLWYVNCPGHSFSCPYISWEFLPRVIGNQLHPIQLQGRTV